MGLPVLQRYDEINKDQIIEGVNGFTFYDEKSMADCLNKIINMSPSDFYNLKTSVRESVINKSAVNVAKNILSKYPVKCD